MKVVITDYEYKSLTTEQDVLKTVGIELITAQCKTEEEVIEACSDADGILNQYAPITRRVIENLKNCKVIARYGVGVNTIDVDAATEKGIIVSNVTDYCIDEVSDHAFALLMSAARKVVALNNSVKKGTWDFNIGVPIFRLRGRVLGLVGFGQIPQALAKKAQGFGIEVVAFDPFVREEIASQLNVQLVTLEELCKNADFISVHAPLNEQTQGLLSDAEFSLMKTETFIINTARGPVIDEKSLIRALQSGTIAGAALDVLEEEPIPIDNPLLKMENVILNPHVAWYSEEAQEELKRKTAQNVADVLSGFFPKYFVNSSLKQVLHLKEQ
ncbi:C-terminal binding protein [Anaerobacillus alkaliphilus]|uniref:C-terminal binding protein n=1 Tax=Anaerobacillus alkaliphilus TaxID=1548597 RepID=A0A4Q0VWT6_9BACI|nr:C-terminal binding protein [Anaerobacillus alkaliphilus]RXJ02038.1 C-terminal binding protein [Anaerobacillus alkaliphilus]